MHKGVWERLKKAQRQLSYDLSPRVSDLHNQFQAHMMKLVNVSEISSTAPVRAGKDQVLFDSGANCCVTNQREDFVGEYKRTSGNQTVDGIGKCLKIEGTGHVAWTFVADNGQYRTLKLPCLYVPTMNGRIASMQEILSKPFLSPHTTKSRTCRIRTLG